MSATISTDAGTQLVVCFACMDVLRTSYSEQAEAFRIWHRDAHNIGGEARLLP